MVVGLLVGVSALGQSDARATLESEAHKLFVQEHWEQAHQGYAELLSIDGTNVFLQMRYAATLLHDPRRRMEGIQRLAELVERGDIPPECKYWWGRALMYEGDGQLAIKYLEEAQSEGDKNRILARALFARDSTK